MVLLLHYKNIIYSSSALSFFLAESASWIQQNFTYLQKELPKPDYMLAILGNCFGEIDKFDIEYRAMRKKAKLLKILLRKGEDPCNDLLQSIKDELKRGDMIDKMKENSLHLRERGIVTNLQHI